MSWVCWEISLGACIDSLCDIQQRVGLQLLFQIQFVSALSTETFWEVGQTKQTETYIIVRTHRYTTCPCPSFRKTMLSCSCVTTHMAASPLLPPLFTCMLYVAFPLFITSPACLLPLGKGWLTLIFVWLPASDQCCFYCTDSSLKWCSSQSMEFKRKINIIFNFYQNPFWISEVAPTRPSAYINLLSWPTCLSWGCVLSALEDRDGCKLLSSELQRDSSGESRWQRSLDRPRSLSPCCHFSERDTRKKYIRQATSSEIKRMWSHI